MSISISRKVSLLDGPSIFLWLTGPPAAHTEKSFYQGEAGNLGSLGDRPLENQPSNGGDEGYHLFEVSTLRHPHRH